MATSGLSRRRKSAEAAVAEPLSIDQVSQIVIRILSEGKPVEIDGLGVFYPDPERGCRFEPSRAPKAFIAYAREDRDSAEVLYDALECAGLSVWMDVRKLLPGQNWPRAI